MFTGHLAAKWNEFEVEVVRRTYPFELMTGKKFWVKYRAIMERQAAYQLALYQRE